MCEGKKKKYSLPMTYQKDERFDARLKMIHMNSIQLGNTHCAGHGEWGRYTGLSHIAQKRSFS